MIENQSILLIKPCGMQKMVDRFRLVDVIEGLINSTGLSIDNRRCLTLSPPQIRGLYPKLDRPDPIHGDGWKQPLLDHLQSGESTVYSITGERAATKIRIMKRAIREGLAGDGSLNSKLLTNLIHVTDPIDYDREHRLLFGS